MRPPFWVESPINVLNFGILPTTWEATLGQEISHCGSGICLGNCMFAPSTHTCFLLSPPNVIAVQHAHLCGNIPSNIYTVTQPHLDRPQFIIYFSMSPPSVKTNKVFFSSSVCTTICSTVVFSYTTSPAMISEFINTRENACPLCNSIIKTTALWLLSLIGIRGNTYSWWYQHFHNIRIQMNWDNKWYVLLLFLLRLLLMHWYRYYTN